MTLDISDVDLTAWTIRIRTPGRKQRTIPINPATIHEIKRYIELRSEKTRQNGKLASQALFINRLSGRLSTRTVRRKMDGQLTAAGLDHSFSPRSLRHSFTAHKLNAGCELQHVQDMLGNQSPVSIQVYLSL